MLTNSETEELIAMAVDGAQPPHGPSLLAKAILDLMERLDRAESAARRAANVASCSANGIKSD